MGGKFGKDVSATKQESTVATISSSDKVKLQLKLQRDNLSAAIRRYERVGDLEHEKAKEFLKAGNKRKASYCLKREKQQVSQISTVTAMLDNVQQLIDTVEFQSIELEVVSAMKDGKGELEKLNKMLNVDDIQKLMDDTAETLAEAQQIDEILRQPIAGVEDDNDLLEELRATMNDNTVKDSIDKISGVKVPQHNIGQPVDSTQLQKKEERKLQAA